MTDAAIDCTNCSGCGMYSSGVGCSSCRGTGHKLCDICGSEAATVERAAEGLCLCAGCAAAEDIPTPPPSQVRAVTS